MVHFCWWQVTIHIIIIRKSPSWTETFVHSAHTDRIMTSHLMVITLNRESKRQLDTQIPLIVPLIGAGQLHRWLLTCFWISPANEWQGSNQFSFKSAAHLFFFLPPTPFLPFHSSLTLEHWCKNFNQHQPWCNSIWFTGSWRLFLAWRHAEQQKLWRSCSCLDKSQVKIKVVDTFWLKSKSQGRKNLERCHWIWTVGLPGTFNMIWITVNNSTLELRKLLHQDGESHASC